MLAIIRCSLLKSKDILMNWNSFNICEIMWKNESNVEALFQELIIIFSIVLVFIHVALCEIRDRNTVILVFLDESAEEERTLCDTETVSSKYLTPQMANLCNRIFSSSYRVIRWPAFGIICMFDSSLLLLGLA